MSFSRSVAQGLACLLLLCPVVAAALFTGTVKDPSGAVIPGVTVQLQNTATGAAKSAVTDKTGRFRFADVAPGVYQMRIEHTGFQAYTATVDIGPSGAEPADIRLALAEVKEDIEVAAKRSRSANSDPTYRKLRDGEIAETYTVENLVIKRDAAVLTLQKGTVSFTAPITGRVTTAVFVGEGEFAFAPLLGSEQEHMKSITGRENVKEPFRRAMLSFTDGTYDEVRRSARKAEPDSHAVQALRDFRQRLRRRNETPRSMLESLLAESAENVDAETLADLMNPKQPGFFNAYLSGGKYNDLRFLEKPRGALPVLPSPEELAVINVDPGADQEGIWYLGHISEEYNTGQAAATEDKRTVAAESYRIDTAIGRNNHLAATENFRFRGVRDGDRVVRFSLLPNLRVTKVSIPGGAEVPFIQEERKSDAGFYVVLPEAIVKEKTYELLVEYQGDQVVHDAGGGNFSVEARTSWYPNVNTFRDRAKFELTFRVPKQFTLVSVGRQVKESVESGFAVTEWKSDRPLPVAGLNYGLFKKKEVADEPTKTTIEGYAVSDLPGYMRGAEAIGGMSPARLLDRALAETQNALRIYNQWFGSPPYSRIAITQQPQFNFGQSWPGLVYLPLSAFLDSTQRWRLFGPENLTSMTAFIDEVTPHEVSHQWWGHQVGWASYRDQWLSEGFAEFSAGLYLQYTEKKPDKYLQFWDRLRDHILQKGPFGQSPNDSGPLWMGYRVNTVKNPRAYASLIYPKGAYVLHMLRAMMFDKKTGDAEFIKMMRDFVATHNNQNASTENFQAIVEKHMTPEMNLDGSGRMDWFFWQWVYGTEVPRYQFEYKVTPDPEKKWLLTASLTQSEVSPTFRMLVPIYLDLDGQIVRLGSIRITGTSTVKDMKVALPGKPKRVLINAYHDVLERK